MRPVLYTVFQTDTMERSMIPMRYTSAEAAKLLRKLNEDYQALTQRESKASVFTAAVEENVEDVRPLYDFADTNAKMRELTEKIRKVKHAVNAFNLKTEVPGFQMTIDQMLVYIPQLSEQKRRLTEMAARLPKERVNSYGARTIVEYNYTNYSVEDAAKELAAVTDELAKAQTALDVVNNSEAFEIEV